MEKCTEMGHILGKTRMMNILGINILGFENKSIAYCKTITFKRYVFKVNGCMEKAMVMGHIIRKGGINMLGIEN